MDIKHFILENCYKNNILCRLLDDTEWWVKHGYQQYDNTIRSLTSFLPNEYKYRVRIYCILNDIVDMPLCICGKNVNWQNSVSKFSTFCSRSCSSLNSRLKREDTNIQRYGVKNPFQSDDIKAKIKDTNLLLYGADNPSKSEKIKNKIKKTFCENYASGHPMRDATIKEKVSKTCNDRYGADSPLESSTITSKIKDTMVSKYGVEYALQNTDLLKKQKSTMVDRFGVESFQQRHLTVENMQYRKELTPYDIVDRSKLGLSVSHTYKVLATSGFVFSPSRSLAENEIASFIENELGRPVLRNHKISGVEFDIYDTVLQLAIEFNGVYFHTEKFGKGPAYHLHKTTIANNNGIRLIHILSTEWENKSEIVKSRIRSAISKITKLFARKCKIREVESTEERNFLNETHIQGYTPSAYCVGLYLDDNLVALMSFIKSRYNKNYQWELLRFSNCLNHTVLGGASRLFTHFVKNKNPDSVVSYCDRRWGTGNLYRQMGFNEAGVSPPGFFYLVGNKLESRVKYQKFKLTQLPYYDNGLSAAEIMKRNGYYRLWDCGNFIFSFYK